jgi:predicted SprT family Zn-dependent metalloprotease
MAKTVTVTAAQFAAYQRMADYFNKTLFGGTLPQVILNFSRKNKTFGFFAPERWESTTEGEAKRVHEISLNPEHIAKRPPQATAGTLAHELAHLWQQEFGSPTRNGYHNKEWGTKMEEIGLMPSATAAPGGKRTGQKVSHYIIEGGAFEEAWAKMPEDCLLPWAGHPEPKKETKKSSRFKYLCPGCGIKVWGKQGLNVTCSDCGEELGVEEVGGEPTAKPFPPALRIAADKGKS